MASHSIQQINEEHLSVDQGTMKLRYGRKRSFIFAGFAERASQDWESTSSAQRELIDRGIGFNYTKVLLAVLFHPLQLDKSLNQELEIS